MPQVFNRTRRMHQNSSVVHRDYGNIRVVLFMKSIEACMENRLKITNILGEYARSNFLYMKNTPVDITLSLTSANFREKKMIFLFQITFLDRIEWATKRAVPLKTQKLLDCFPDSKILFPFVHLHGLSNQCTEAEFLDGIQTKVLRVFLLAIHSHLYSFALRYLFLQTHTTSYVKLMYSVHCKGERRKTW